MEDRKLCGWRVASDLPLPELLPWRGDDAVPAGLTIRLGEVPERLDEPRHHGPLLQIGRDGSCRYAIAGVAAYLVDAAGSCVTIAPLAEPDAPDIRLFLLGTVLGLLCYKRGLLPLHAACVEIDGRVVAVAGPSGVGKSTLAAALGTRLLSDDVTAIEVAPPSGGGPRVWPSFPRQKLWRDTLEALVLPIGTRLRPRAREMDKFEHPVADFALEPMPLAAVCHLGEGRLERRPPLSRLSGLQTMTVTQANLYRRPAGEALVGVEETFRAAAALAGAVPHFSLHRPRLFAELPDFAAALPDLLRQELP